MGSLHKPYIDAMKVLDDAKEAIKKIVNEFPETKGEENLEAYYALESIAERLESTSDYLAYLSAPTKEGVLSKDPETGKFFLQYQDGTESYPLSCGNSLEMFLDDEWIIARVEAKDGKYYFHGGNRPFLEEGMKARKRTI